MHELLVDRLGGLRLPRKSVVRLVDRPDMTKDVYRGRKTTTQQQQTHFCTAKSNRSIFIMTVMGVPFFSNFHENLKFTLSLNDISVRHKNEKTIK